VGSANSAFVHSPPLSNHCLKGSAFGEGIDFTKRNKVSGIGSIVDHFYHLRQHFQLSILSTVSSSFI
jgi:hypothetical protein